ncbi:MAG: type IV pilin protein [Blastocatellia bacterium]
MMRHQRQQLGFSLLELLMVVAIIGVIASIALPRLSVARKQSLESSAVGNVRTLITAQWSYLHAKGHGSEFADLTGLVSNSIIDTTFTGNKGDYTFEITQTRGLGSFDIKASPQSPGMRWFFASEDGRILVNTVDDVNTAYPLPRLT